jgi:hypothetical protein
MVRYTSNLIIIAGWLGHCHLCLVGSFQPPTAPLLTRRPFDAGRCLRPDLRFSFVFPLKSTTVPSSSTSETIPDDDGDDDDNNKEIPSAHTSTNQVVEEENLSFPWSDVQDWVLRDNLSKYTVMIPLNIDAKQKEESTQVYALWRTMLKEVPELTGYPIDFLQDMHARQQQKGSSQNNNNKQTLVLATPALLPYLEEYDFASAGGIMGKIYGVPGLADGTRIETSEVANIELTLPKGFIRTSDGSAAYELGRPKREEFSEGAAFAASGSFDSVKSGSSKFLKTVQTAVPENLEDADGMLVRLGASTGILLAGATALSMLSHHMTVNVFWV